VLLFLGFGAVGDERRSDNAQAQAVDRARDVAAGHLFGHNGLFHRPRVLAAVRARPTHADQAGLVQRALPGLALRHGLQRPGRVLGKPFAHVQAECFVLG
jgi:hypothetical protein